MAFDPILIPSHARESHLTNGTGLSQYVISSFCLSLILLLKNYKLCLVNNQKARTWLTTRHARSQKYRHKCSDGLPGALSRNPRKKRDTILQNPLVYLVWCLLASEDSKQKGDFVWKKIKPRGPAKKKKVPGWKFGPRQPGRGQIFIRGPILFSAPPGAHVLRFFFDKKFWKNL